ncbi:hypothetical protein PSMK_06490 [Phycisphaera mikurensis NBRC 102666]|uniref:Uncharacterized protein n=1 Tax=Phycisphaera mikurensis (strain NBRC 102666 / KCTC 22515 / FYK2301M01) TaxID=1142394 RepID=I0IC20_PHYMF|nr:hypothetical protein PSMK_06490 [Phycisphaera mikurensis NBRC 102666]
MSLVSAVIAAGVFPGQDAPAHEKKRYAEKLSHAVAPALASALRARGLTGTRPLPGQPGEKAFQGGLGPKRVDVSFSDERHGLLLAVSVKSITAPPFSKNLKNRFGDLCTEAITLHMRFPYSIVCCLFAFPAAADDDVTPGRPMSTFRRALKMMSTISGREEYTDPGEKFESVTMMLFNPADESGEGAWVKLYNADTGEAFTESEYIDEMVTLYNRRNPHAEVEALDE